jgi:hypothetical protein
MMHHCLLLYECMRRDSLLLDNGKPIVRLKGYFVIESEK